MSIQHAAPGEIIQLPLGAALGSSKTTLVKTADLELIRLVLPAGKDIPLHKAPGEITVQCLEGRVAFTAEGKTQELTAGQLLYLTAGEPHAVKGIEDSSLLVTLLLPKNKPQQQFDVRLPVTQGGPVQERQPSKDGAASAARRRTLVVDDNRDGASSLAMLLTFMGHDTRIAHDGLEGVELAEAFRPDLIVLDIGLPKLNGLDACRRIRELPWAKNVVIVAATGWGQDEDRQRSEAAGFDHHLVKPVDAALLGKLAGKGSDEKVEDEATYVCDSCGKGEG